MPEKTFTAEEVAAAVVEGNRQMVEKLGELCNRIAAIKFQRDQLLVFVQRVSCGNTSASTEAAGVLLRVERAEELMGRLH